jgi:hypothetical protein
MRYTLTILHILIAVQHSTCRLYKFGCSDKFVIKKGKNTKMPERAYACV